MNYLFNDFDTSITDRICQINNVDIKDLDVSTFNVDYNLEPLITFKNKLNEFKDKKFLIVSDYDCDGICSCAIIKRLLDDLNIQNNYYIPSRSKQGYGLNFEIVENAKKHNFDVIFCIDNGVVALDELKLAHDYNIKTMIIDHHEYSVEPDVDAFLHPNLFDKPYYDMCAAGLSTLLSNSYRQDDLSTVYGGLASIADMVSVFGYNRYLIKEMMNILNNKQIVPIKYLLNKNNLSYESLSYIVIPKINAISRLEEKMNVNYMVKYLLNNDDSCLTYLDKIEDINKTRKDLSNQMYSLALRLADNSKDVIVVKSDVFKEGLCGIIANRLMNELNKPVLILTETSEEIKGSGRSINGSNFYEYLNKISDVFETFGGHAQAVGLSLKKDRYEELISYIDNNEFIFPVESKDVLLIEQNEINFDLLNEIDNLKPFGIDFKEPLIGIKDVKVINKFVVAQKYPKFKLNDNLEAISFNINDNYKDFDTMIGKIKKDDYKQNMLSLIIEDLIEF